MRQELAATLRLSAPLAAANLLQMLVHAIDVMFVAKLGEQALAASALALAIYALMQWCFSGVTGACAPLIASELGRRAHAVREVRRSVRMALWLGAILSAVGIVIAANGERFMLLTGQDPGISALAGRFLTILMWSMIPMIAANVLRTFVSALGRPLYATAITALAIGVNALGNYAFINGHFGVPAMGLEGSAVSSVLTSCAMLIAYIVAIRRDRRLRRYHILGRWWRPEWQRFREICRIGAPIGLTILAEAGLFSGAAFLMGRIGAAELAAHTLALQVASLAFQVPFGLGQAATIRVGYHYGARDHGGIARAGTVALWIAVAFMASTAALMLFVPDFVLSLYFDPAAPANRTVRDFAVSYMAVAAAFQLFDGIQAVAMGNLRGLQDTKVPMAFALFGYWVPGVATAIWLGFYTPLAGTGVWAGLAVGLIVVAALLLWRWKRRAALGLLPA